jgi:hypothetical protein
MSPWLWDDAERDARETLLPHFHGPWGRHQSKRSVRSSINFVTSQTLSRASLRLWRRVRQGAISYSSGSTSLARCHPLPGISGHVAAGIAKAVAVQNACCG